MGLPASGAISLSQIAGEFGGSAPHRLSEYYGAASGVMTSGTINMNTFHGKASVPIVKYITRVNGTGSFGTQNIGAKEGGGYRCVVLCLPNMNKYANRYNPPVTIYPQSGSKAGQGITATVVRGVACGGCWEEYAAAYAFIPDDCSSVSASVSWSANHGRVYFMWVVDKLQQNSHVSYNIGNPTIATQVNDVLIWGTSAGGARDATWNGASAPAGSITAPASGNSYCWGSSEAYIATTTSVACGGASNETGVLRFR